MAAPFIEVSNFNPFNAVDKNRTLPANYHWKHFDAWMAREQFMQMDSRPCFFQKWQNDDIIFMQVKANFDPIFVNIRDSKGKIILTHQMELKATYNEVSYFQDNVAFDDLDIFPEGYYCMEIWAGLPVQVLLEAEPFYIKEQHENTLLIKVSNDFNNEFLWETGIAPNFRVDGVLPLNGTGSNRTSYIDQVYNAKTVKSSAFDTYNLSIGTQGGHPKWYFTKLEDYLGQNNLQIDGRGFAAAAGAEFTFKQIDRYPLWQGDINIMPSFNQRGKRFAGGGGIIENAWTTTYVIEGALFGPVAGPGNDNSYSIDKLT